MLASNGGVSEGEEQLGGKGGPFAVAHPVEIDSFDTGAGEAELSTDENEMSDTIGRKAGCSEEDTCWALLGKELLVKRPARL